MKSADLSPDEVLIDALLETHASDPKDDDAFVQAIFERTTRGEGHEDPAIHSLLTVYRERAGGVDHELVESVQTATTRRSAAEPLVIPFPERAGGFFKIAAIVIVFCGGLYGLVSTIPVNWSDGATASSDEMIVEPRMHVTIVHSKPLTPRTPSPSIKRAERSSQWSAPFVASAASDFVSSIDFALSDPAVQFGLPKTAELSTEILSDRPVRANPGERLASATPEERYASAPSDRALAIVNRSVITERDLERFQSTQSEPVPKQAAIESLVDERLLLGEFARRGGQVTGAFVDQAMAGFIDQAFGGDRTTFEQSIHDAALSSEDFRDLLERQIAVRGLLASEPTLASQLRQRAEILLAK